MLICNSRAFPNATHGPNGVNDQVQHHLLQLDPVALNARQVLRKLRPHRHAIVCGLRTGESNNLKNGIVDRYGILSCGHLLDERTNSLDDLACSIPLFDNKRERVIDLANIRWISRLASAERLTRM